MSGKGKRKPLPKHQSDKEAEDFEDNADLSEYDFKGLSPAKFEFAPKDERIIIRVPEDLLNQIKQLAAAKKLPYSRYIRQILVGEVAREMKQTSK